MLPDSAVQDARNAYEWMLLQHARYNVDPTRIALIGGSAGGHIAAASALNCSTSSSCRGVEATRPFALGLLNPVLELTVANEAQGYTKEELQLIEALGDEGARELSLGGKVALSDIPTQIIYGGLDPLLPIASDLLSTEGASSRHNLELLIAPGEKHGFFNYEPWRTAVATSLLGFLQASGLGIECKGKHISPSKLQKAQ